MRIRGVLGPCLACWLVSLTAYAQTGGVVAGTVTDQTGAVLPGVTVDIRPTGAQNFIETVTDGSGTYRFDNVPAGAAEVTFRLINFSAVRQVVTVTQGGAATANARMLVSTSADIT